MDEPALRQLLADVAAGTCPADDAVRRLRRLPYADLGFARVDHHRALRQGIPEAVYGPGKTPDQCAAIVVELLEEPGGPVLLTRAHAGQVEATTAAAAAAGHGEGTVTGAGELATVAWRPAAARPGRHLWAGRGGRSRTGRSSPMDAAGGPADTATLAGSTAQPGRVLVLTAGTADLPVADECRAVLEALGFRPALLTDCGVAGVHRLLASVDELAGADAVVVVAGMEGALASLVGGITPAPVVAVPTSVGYGAALEGVTALLAMLASCASGVTVVGIDNGFGAACAVARLLP